MLTQHQVGSPTLAFKGYGWPWLSAIVIGVCMIVRSVLLSPWQSGGGGGSGANAHCVGLASLCATAR